MWRYTFGETAESVFIEILRKIYRKINYLSDLSQDIQLIKFSSSSIFAYLIRSNMKLVVNFPPALRMFYPGTKNKPIHCIISPNVLYLRPVCPKHDRFRVNNTGSFAG